eukprot:gene12560-16845_t
MHAPVVLQHYLAAIYKGKRNDLRMIDGAKYIGKKCEVHQYVFLLQNWWNNRYFIEVSAKYMADAGTMISFVDVDITEIPTDYPLVYTSFAETSVDVSERMDEI